jgi:hypothetical protein
MVMLISMSKIRQSCDLIAQGGASSLPEQALFTSFDSNTHPRQKGRVKRENPLSQVFFFEVDRPRMKLNETFFPFCS